MVTNVLLVGLSMNNEVKGSICVAVVVFGLAVIGTVLGFMAKFDKTIPSEEQKPKKQVQTIPEHKTEIMTHVIRCTTFVNDTCTEYKVYKVVKE